MSDLSRWDTAIGVIRRAAIIPHDHIAKPPIVTVDQFVIQLMFKDRVQNGPRLLIGHTLNANRKAMRHIESLASSFGMSPGDWVNAVRWRAIGIAHLGVAFVHLRYFHSRIAHTVKRMDGVAALNLLAQFIRQDFKRRVLITKTGIAALFRQLSRQQKDARLGCALQDKSECQ